MYCESCGNQGVGGDKHCRQCGEEADVCLCSECDSIVNEQDNFCHSCGAEMSEDDEGSDEDHGEPAEEPSEPQPPEPQQPF